MKTFFTSEAVCKGHPDKLCDSVADAILDAIIKEDKEAHTAIEVVAAYDSLTIIGEVKTKAKVNYEQIARSTIKDIGYIDQKFGFPFDKIKVNTYIHEQSSDIDMGVSGKTQMGAGDQGIMFGYACLDTPNYMPLAYSYAQQIAYRLDSLKATTPFLGPDGKCQVTIEKENGQIKRVDTVVVSNQHSADIELNDLRKFILHEVVYKVIPASLLDENTTILVNPTGRFVIGGPFGDSGLTGRKIVCDTYGGYAPHGGGAFSGKDPSKVDRSAAYYLRYIAKNLVAAGLVDEITLQASYAIGMPKAISLYLDTHNSEHVSIDTLYHAIDNCFDLSVSNIIKELDLRKPIYSDLTNYGHFGRSYSSFEQLGKVKELREYTGK